MLFPTASSQTWHGTNPPWRGWGIPKSPWLSMIHSVSSSMTWMIWHPHDFGNPQKVFASNAVTMNQPSKLSNGELFNCQAKAQSVAQGGRLHLLFDKFGHFRPCGEVWEFHPYLGAQEILPDTNPPHQTVSGEYHCEDPMESPHPNCLVQRQKCKSMDWVTTSGSHPAVPAELPTSLSQKRKPRSGEMFFKVGSIKLSTKSSLRSRLMS